MVSFPTYLEARKSVDDEALNDAVFKICESAMTTRHTAVNRPLRIVEIGGGIGTMPARLVERNVLRGEIDYRFIEKNPTCSEYAKRWIRGWFRSHGYDITAERDTITIQSEDLDLSVTVESRDAFSIETGKQRFDAVIGSAVFDVLSVDRAMPWIASALTPGGIVYAPLTYDGHTAFSPPDPRDSAIEDLYHQHMDEVREQPGGSRAGQEWVDRFDQAEAFLLRGSGSADWSVGGDIPDQVGIDHSIVLECVLETIEKALSEVPHRRLTEQQKNEWFLQRRQLLEEGSLTLTAQHVDLVAEKCA